MKTKLREKEKRKNRRNTTKYPNLKKEFTIKRRREFLETEYVNGVTNKDGEMVIRPLNDEEKEWLDQFYKETLNTSFSKNISFYPIPGTDDMNSREIKEIRQEFLNEDKSINYEKLDDIKFVSKIARKYSLPDETIVNLIKRKEIYDANNAINNDYINNSLRSSCEMKCEEEEDFYIPMGNDSTDNAFEDGVIEYLDYEHRQNMGWDDPEWE